MLDLATSHHTAGKYFVFSFSTGLSCDEMECWMLRRSEEECGGRYGGMQELQSALTEKISTTFIHLQLIFLASIRDLLQLKTPKYLPSIFLHSDDV